MHTSPTILDDLENGEEPMTLGKAIRDSRLCVDGRAHNVSWGFKAALNGCRGADGNRVKLETIIQAGKRVTTRSAIGRFIARQAGIIDSPLLNRSSLPEGVAHAAAKKRLAAAGL